jgi:hypothetical protein
MPVCADLAPPVTHLPGGQRASCHLLTEGAVLSA